jgi:hypothetical protein
MGHEIPTTDDAVGPRLGYPKPEVLIVMGTPSCPADNRVLSRLPAGRRSAKE